MVQLPYVPLSLNFHQVLLKTQQFRVFTSIVRQDWDSIGDLIKVAERAVIHQNNLRKISIDDSEIFGIDLIMQFHAMFTIKSVWKEFIVRIQLIKNSISVATLARSESKNLKVLFTVFQEAESIGSDRHICFLDAAFYWNVDLDILRIFSIFLAMKQSFIEIQDQNMAWSFGSNRKEFGLMVRFWELNWSGRIHNLMGDSQVFKSSFVYTRYSSYNFFKIVGFNFVGPENTFFAICSYDQFAVTL